MGFSYSRTAGETMDRIEVACKASRPHDESTSNVFYANGERYFYEISRRDQNDCGLAGTIHLCLPGDFCRQVGRFRIDGQGKVVRGPKLFRDASAKQ